MPSLFCCFSGNKNSTHSYGGNTTIFSSESAQPSYNHRTHNEHGIIHNNERPVRYDDGHSVLYHNQRRIGQNDEHHVAYHNDRVSEPNTLRPEQRSNLFANEYQHYRTNPEISINSNIDHHQRNYTGAFYAPGHQQSDSSDSLDSYEQLRITEPITDSQNRPQFSHSNSSYAPVTHGISSKNATVVSGNYIHIKNTSKHRKSEKIQIRNSKKYIHFNQCFLQAVPDMKSADSLPSAVEKNVGSSNGTLFTIGVKSEGSNGSANVPSIQL